MGRVGVEMAANRRARRRLYVAVIAISALVGAVCAGFASGIGPFPPNGGPGSLQVATATTHVLVDAPLAIDRPASRPSTWPSTPASSTPSSLAE